MQLLFSHLTTVFCAYR